MDYLVCTCMGVMHDEIVADVKSGAIKNLSDAAQKHGIGTGCKSCVPEVEAFIKQYGQCAKKSGCCRPE